MYKLAVILSHPVQYYSPLFIELAKQQELKVFYGYQPNSLQQGKDGFGEAFQWDIDLLNGYEFEFLENVSSSPSSAYYKGCDTPSIGERLREYGATHIVSFGWHLKMYRQVLTYAKGKKIPIAVRGDSQLNPSLPWWKKAVKQVYYPFFLNRYDAFLSVGQRNWAYLKHYGVKDEKIIFSPHAIDQLFWKGGQRKQTNNFKFVWVAKFIPKKRPLDVIKAFNRLVADEPVLSKLITLQMVGSGPLLARAELEAQGNDQIQFLGFKNQTELKSIYTDSNCLILSSDYGETWGLVVNEAFAAGIPAIVSDACGCSSDLIDKTTGCTYALGKIDSLVLCLTSMIKKLSSKEDSNNLKEAIQQKNSAYSYKKVVESINYFLEQYN